MPWLLTVFSGVSSGEIEGHAHVRAQMADSAGSTLRMPPREPLALRPEVSQARGRVWCGRFWWFFFEVFERFYMFLAVFFFFFPLFRRFFDGFQPVFTSLYCWFWCQSRVDLELKERREEQRRLEELDASVGSRNGS